MGTHGFSALIGAYLRGLVHGFWQGSVLTRGLRILGLCLGVGGWFLVFWGCQWGVSQLAVQTPLAAAVVGKSFEILLLLFLWVLTFSSALVAVAHLYLANDITLAATFPVSENSLFFAKWVEVALVASWMPIVFGAALLSGLGVALEAPPLFYPVMMLVLLLSAAIPTAAAMGATSLVVTLLPANRTRDVMIFLTLAALLTVYIVVRSMEPERLVNPEVIRDFSAAISHLELPAARYAPSSWAANLLRSLIEGKGPMVRDALLLFGAALLSSLFALTSFRLFFRRGLSRTLSSRGHAPERTSRGARWAGRLIALFSRRVGAIAHKDLLTFGRDTSQWSQLFLLGAVVVIYLMNMLAFPTDELGFFGLSEQESANLFAFLNLALAGFVLAAVAARFLFAAVSLEARSVWVVFSAPLSIPSLLAAKLVVGLPLLWAFGVVLVGGSNLVLEADGPLTMVSYAGMTLLCVGLGGLGVGLGAMMPKFRAESLARIAGSVGGLVFMISALIYVVVMVLLLAYPVLVLVRREGGVPPSTLEVLLASGSAAGSLALTAVVFALPLFLGVRSLERRETVP